MKGGARDATLTLEHMLRPDPNCDKLKNFPPDLFVVAIMGGIWVSLKCSQFRWPSESFFSDPALGRTKERFKEK